MRLALAVGSLRRRTFVLDDFGRLDAVKLFLEAEQRTGAKAWQRAEAVALGWRFQHLCRPAGSHAASDVSAVAFFCTVGQK